MFLTTKHVEAKTVKRKHYYLKSHQSDRTISQKCNKNHLCSLQRMSNAWLTSEKTSACGACTMCRVRGPKCSVKIRIISKVNYTTAIKIEKVSLWTYQAGGLQGYRTRCHRQRAPGWIPEKVTWDWSARSSYRFANFLIRDQWETWVAQSSLHLGVWDCVVRCVDQDALKRWPPPHNLSTLWGFVRITKQQVSFQTFCGARRPGLHPTICVSQASQCCAA